MNTFEKCTNIDYLKNRIIPLGKKVCNRSSERSIKGFNFPLSWYNDLVYICKLYNGNFEIRNCVSGDPAGGYNTKNKLIYITTVNGAISPYNICKTFTHELAHRIQHIIIEKNNSTGKLRKKYFSEWLLYERVAERLAYFINKEYFEHLYKLHHRIFKSYNKKLDVVWFKNFLNQHKVSLIYDI